MCNIHLRVHMPGNGSRPSCSLSHLQWQIPSAQQGVVCLQLQRRKMMTPLMYQDKTKRSQRSTPSPARGGDLHLTP